MDGWTVAQLKRVFAGGNEVATEHFAKHGINVNNLNSRTKSIENKYCSKAARIYKTWLDQRIKMYELDDDIKQIINAFVADKKAAAKKRSSKKHRQHDSSDDLSLSSSSDADNDEDDSGAAQTKSNGGSVSLISAKKKEQI